MIITIIRNNEGFGALYQSIISGIAWCRYNNYTFIYTSPSNIWHGTTVDNFNHYLSLKSDDIKDEKNTEINVYPFIKEVHFSPTPDIYYTPEFREELRSRYYINNEKKVIDKIVIHIRRGDVIMHNMTGRIVPLPVYIPIIKMLKEKYEKKVLIVSEGREEDFVELVNGCDESNDTVSKEESNDDKEDFVELVNGCDGSDDKDESNNNKDKKEESNDIEFLLNGNEFHAFHTLVCAKILVMAKSSFSYTAALLSKEEVYYIPMKHKPLKEWNVLEI